MDRLTRRKNNNCGREPFAAAAFDHVSRQETPNQGVAMSFESFSDETGRAICRHLSPQANITASVTSSVRSLEEIQEGGIGLEVSLGQHHCLSAYRSFSQDYAASSCKEAESRDPEQDNCFLSFRVDSQDRGDNMSNTPRNHHDNFISSSSCKEVDSRDPEEDNCFLSFRVDSQDRGDNMSNTPRNHHDNFISSSSCKEVDSRDPEEDNCFLSFRVDSQDRGDNMSNTPSNHQDIFTPPRRKSVDSCESLNTNNTYCLTNNSLKRANPIFEDDTEFEDYYHQNHSYSKRRCSIERSSTIALYWQHELKSADE